MSERNGAAFGLGVTIGILSFHAAAGHHRETMEALETAHEAGVRARNSGLKVNIAPLTPEGGGDQDDTSEEIHNLAVHLRGEWQGVIANAYPQAGQAFVLGVTLGIAEGQATAGEAARGIVHDGLANAVPLAQDLGLDAARVEDIRERVVAGVGLPEIHQRMVHVRGLYQASLTG